MAAVAGRWLSTYGVTYVYISTLCGLGRHAGGRRGRYRVYTVVPVPVTVNQAVILSENSSLFASHLGLSIPPLLFVVYSIGETDRQTDREIETPWDMDGTWVLPPIFLT